jgi:hypothetical protein
MGQMNRPHKFKNRDITRCLRAASNAGVTHPTVEIHLMPSGTTKYVVGGEVVPQSKKSEHRGAGVKRRQQTGSIVSGKNKKSPSGGLSLPARGGQTGT